MVERADIRNVPDAQHRDDVFRTIRVKMLTIFRHVVSPFICFYTKDRTFYGSDTKNDTIVDGREELFRSGEKLPRTYHVRDSNGKKTLFASSRSVSRIIRRRRVA